ncbi:MAG: hypothetical protein JW781_02500 [Deltaproteobacteria bacterium]|nr:hypothetical protein [Candidatus Anaeroferrophillacea bacterium]
MVKNFLTGHHFCRRLLFLLLFPGLLLPGCAGARPGAGRTPAAESGILRLIYGGGLLATIKPCG